MHGQASSSRATERTLACCAAKINQRPLVLRRKPDGVGGLEVSVDPPSAMERLELRRDVHQHLHDVALLSACSAPRPRCAAPTRRTLNERHRSAVRSTPAAL